MAVTAMLIGMNLRTQAQGYHVPGGWEALEVVVFALHVDVAEAKQRRDQNQRHGQQQRVIRQGDVTINEQRGDKHVRQVVDDQIEDRAIETWQYRLDIDLACQRAIQPIDDQGDAQPQQAVCGLVFQQGEGREEGSDHAGGGKTMGAPCFEPGDV
jgi:hypothetical protein